MRLILRGPPVVGLSTEPSVAGQPPGFVVVDVTVRIEPPPKRLPQLTLACSLDSGEMVHRVFEETKLVNNRLVFNIPREHFPEDGCLTLSAELDDAVLWQNRYRVSWKQAMPFLDQLS